MGVVASGLKDSYDCGIISGIMDEPKKQDAKLVNYPGRYFSPHYDDKERMLFEYRYNSVFSSIDEKNIEVLIIFLDSICSRLGMTKSFQTQEGALISHE